MSFWRSRRAWWACAAALVIIFLLWRPGADRFRTRLEQSLSSALGHKVEIGSVSLQILPRPGFNLSQLSVRDDPQFSLEPILRADEVSATLHPSSLWRWRIEIATLSLKDSSLNLVRRADGRWNLETLLERAAHAPAAPTSKATPEYRPRFPYIEVTNSRVNLKLGAEKMPYALTDADLALWLESDDEWGLRLRGQPVRTDMRLSDTGTLRANATWRRADDLRKTPLLVTASYDGAQLGQFTKLVYGTDRGWRGTLRVSANLHGTAEDLQLQSEASVDNFRRYDLLAAPSLQIAATCGARFQGSPRQLSQILCSSPAQDGSLLLRGKVGLTEPPAYDLNVNASKFPAQRVLDVLRGVKRGFPEDLSAAGTVSADISFQSDGKGAEIWYGNGTLSQIALRTAVLQTRDGDDALVLGAVPVSVVAQAAAGKTKRAPTSNRAHPAGLSSADYVLEVGPVPVDLGGEAPDTFHAWLSPTGYRARFSGAAPIQRLLEIARAAGATAIHPAIEGDAQFDWQANGAWGAFAPPLTTATLHLSQVRIEFPGLNAPLKIASADVSLTPEVVRVEKLSATAGDMHWAGMVQRPRACPDAPACTTDVDLHADSISLESLNSLLNPNIRKQPWYRILTGTSQQAGSALRSLNVRGTLKVDHLMAGNLTADDATARVALTNGSLHLSDVDGIFFGGRHSGDWVADFSGETPAYTLVGTLDKVALAQLGKPMRSNWITGTARGSYELRLSGWTATELNATARGTLTLFAREGTLPRFGPTAGPVKFQTLEATLAAGQSLVVVSQGKLENAQGVYAISGVGSFVRKLDLKFQREGGRGFAVTGSLDIPHFETLPLTEEAAKAAAPRLAVPDRDR